MRDGWKTHRLGEVCSFLGRGISPTYLEEGGICVLNQKCIRDHLISWVPSRRHDTAKKVVAADRFVQVGDVLVNSTGTGTLGRVAQLREPPAEPTTVDSHVTIVRPRDGLFHPDFFGYMLVVIEDAITAAGEGTSGQTELARSVLSEQFSVSFPESLDEQQRIVRILDEAFDGIATARANAERNLKNATALFESRLHSIIANRDPGWAEAKIDEVIRFIDYRGKTPTKTSSGLRLITAKNVKMGFLQREPEEFVASSSYDSWMTRGIPSKGDVLFTTEAPLANVAQLDTEDKVVFAQRIIVMQPDPSKLDRTFLKYLLLSGPIQKLIHAQGTGATATGIKASLLKLIPISYPSSLPEQLDLVADLDSLSEQTKRIEGLYSRKLAALDELKQSLLHQAFAGEL